MNEALARDNRILVTIMGLILAVFFTINGIHVVKFISHPEYSFISMCEDIKKHVESDKGHNQYIGGNLANSISLQTHIPSVNEFVMIPIEHRLERFKLGYYVSVGDPAPNASRVLDKYYDRRLIKKYDVFHNYWQGKKVFFFALDDKK